MNFSCDVRDLNKAIKIVRRHCSSRAVIPITKCVLLSAMREKVSLATTDMTTSAVFTMDVEDVEEDGTLAVPLKELSALCGKLKGLVTLTNEHDAMQLKIVNGDDLYSLSSFPGEEFPQVIFEDEFETVALPKDTLEEAVSQISVAVAKNRDESRAIMTGVLIEMDDGKLTLASTDGRRLGVFQTDIPGTQKIEVVVRPDSLFSCLEAAKKADQIEIGMSKSRLRVSVPGYQVYAQRIEGRFVAWRKVVPSYFERFFRADRESLIDTLERCLVFAQDENTPGIIYCTFDACGLHVKTFTAGLGDASGSVPGTLEGDDIEIGWNGNYVLDALRVLDCETILWKMQTPVKSGLIADAKNPEKFRYIVMPIKLKDEEEEDG